MNKQLVFLGNFLQHGHTGLAWAARRDILERHGFYDACISGSGDHMMAHAMCNDFGSSCVERLMKKDSKLLKHFINWGVPFYEDVRGKIAFTKGVVVHLWHGETTDRKYIQRHDELRACDFDPFTDLRIGKNGAWEWNSDKPNLHKWAVEYFNERKEDGIS